MDEAGLFDNASLRLIIGLLSDGCFHSGEELGAVLGVSRAAVWKHLQKFELLGIHLNSVKGKGYCLEGGLDLLQKEKIEQLIAAQIHLSLSIELFSVLDSTNSYLMRKESSSRCVCIAESQTAGRGRRGRAWVSPFAQNIYLSMSWGFDGGVAALEGLSLAVGIAIVRSLRKQGVSGLQLKWPNDVLYQEKKLAGILIEMTGDPSGCCQVVIGIGVNVSMNPSVAIDQPWVDLRTIAEIENLATFSRNHIAANLIMELGLMLTSFSADGFGAYRDEWLDLNAYNNRMVELRNGNNVHRGLMVGISPGGALILRTQNGDVVFHGGELSLRIAS